jgi:hypothetical protein
MTLEAALQQLAEGRPVINIGQIDKPTQRTLDRMARRGEIGKVRGYWPHVWSGCGPKKTCYLPMQKCLTVAAG